MKVPSPSPLHVPRLELAGTSSGGGAGSWKALDSRLKIAGMTMNGFARLELFVVTPRAMVLGKSQGYLFMVQGYRPSMTISVIG